MVRATPQTEARRSLAIHQAVIRDQVYPPNRTTFRKAFSSINFVGLKQNYKIFVKK